MLHAPYINHGIPPSGLHAHAGDPLPKEYGDGKLAFNMQTMQPGFHAFPGGPKTG
jgi:hypothetical protein